MHTPLRKLSGEFKATAVYGLTIVLGCVLSAVVYLTVLKVEQTIRELVEHQIPELTLLRETMANVTEQERLLYEYYATTDRNLFTQDYRSVRKATDTDINQIEQRFDDKRPITAIKQHLVIIDRQASEFDNNIDDSSTDWDLAREQLERISTHRRDIIELLRGLEQSTRKDVASGYDLTLSQLTQTSKTVTWYSIAIVIIALVTGWYLRIYLQTSRRNKRLAAFTERNPHPIISVDQHAKIVYYNPATLKLLSQHNIDTSQMSKLIPLDFKETLGATQCPLPFARIEHTLGALYLNIEIHWLDDMGFYDLHISDITAEKSAKQKLEFQAFHCPETLLENNNKLQQVLGQMIKRRQSFAFGLSEIRHYNHFAATGGIEALRALVSGVAQQLLQQVTQATHNIQLFRANERTFAFVIESNISATALATQCQSISDALKAPLASEFGEFQVELDFGFSCYPEHSANADSLMQNAQLALDEAIADENQDFRLYQQSLGDKLNTHLKMTNQLKSALNRDELFMVYQPQLDLASNKIIGMEALVRWQQSNTFVSPAEFIPIAEQTGLIVEIGQWILHQACSMTQALSAQGFKDLIVAVNISPRQFRHPNFFNMVRQVLQQTGLPSKQLELEITEGVIMYNESETIAMLHQLKSLDIQLSIDDFGTGYSSLSYLKQFPVNKLKVDQSFVKNLHTNEEDKAIVQAIVELGKNLNLRTIAEGVEEKAHLDYLSSLGCDEIQGYYFSRPLKKEAFIDFIQAPLCDHKTHQSTAKTSRQ